MLKESILEDTNVVELYFCPESIPQDSSIVCCGWKHLPRIPLKSFRNRLDQELVEYAHKDLLYQYDLSNDGQRVFQRNCLQDKIFGTNYLVSLQEESLPTHRFPSTREINDKKKYKKVQFKVNNRIYLHIEEDVDTDSHNIFLRYQHAHNVDLEKMEEEWQETYKLLMKTLY